MSLNWTETTRGYKLNVQHTTFVARLAKGQHRVHCQIFTEATTLQRKYLNVCLDLNWNRVYSYSPLTPFV